MSIPRPRLLVVSGLVILAVALTAGWFAMASRVITVCVFTDPTFRFSHPNWSAVVNARFRGVNQIYERGGTGVRWKVISAGESDPTSSINGLEGRRTALPFDTNSPAEVLVALTGTGEGVLAGVANPFTRVAVVVDYPNRSEGQNIRLLAHQLAHLFGAPHDPDWLQTIMGDRPESDKFSSRTAHLIHSMRKYPFATGIDGLLQGNWDRRAVQAVAGAYTGMNPNPLSQANYVIGMSLLSDRRRAPAIQHLLAAMKGDPKNVPIRLDLALAYSRDSQSDAAGKILRETLQIAPQSPQAHQAYGAWLGLENRPNEAIPELEQAARLDPANPQTQLALGTQHMIVAGQIDQAIAAYKEVLRLQPNSPAAQLGLQKATEFKARLATDLQQQRNRVQREGNNPEAHYQLGVAAERAGEFRAAIAEFERTCQMQPKNGRPHADLAIVHFLAGEYGSAWQEVKKARGLGTEPPLTLLNSLRNKMPEPRN